MWRPLKVAMETCSFAWSDDFHTGSLAREKDRFPYCGVTECCSNHGLIELDLNFKLSEITWYWRPLNPQLALFSLVMERLGVCSMVCFTKGLQRKDKMGNTFTTKTQLINFQAVWISVNNMKYCTNCDYIFLYSDIEQNGIDFTRQVSTNIVSFLKYRTSKAKHVMFWCSGHSVL